MGGPSDISTPGIRKRGKGYSSPRHSLEEVWKYPFTQAAHCVPLAAVVQPALHWQVAVDELDAHTPLAQLQVSAYAQGKVVSGFLRESWLFAMTIRVVRTWGDDTRSLDIET